MSRRGHSIGEIRPMRILAVLTAALLAGCAAKSKSYNSPTPATSDASYDCVLRKVNDLGYTVTSTSREGRTVTAQKEFHKSATQVFTRQSYFDRLTISISDADSASRTVGITATGSVENAHLLTGTTSRAKAPSDMAQADASAILAACARGLVTKEPGASQQDSRVRLVPPLMLTQAVIRDSARFYALEYERYERRRWVLSHIGATIFALGIVAAIPRPCQKPSCTARPPASVNRPLVVAGLTIALTSLPFKFRAAEAGARALWWHDASLAR
jgi:hypothetical protein